MNADQEQQKIQALDLLPGITIFSKGKYGKVTPVQLAEIKQLGMGWLFYCQKLATQTHKQAIKPVLERLNLLEKGGHQHV